MIRILLIKWAPALSLIICALVIGLLLAMAIRIVQGRFRFSLLSLFLVMTVAALIGGYSLWLRHQYYWQLDAINAVFAEHPEIKSRWMSTTDDKWLEVEQVHFRLENKPGVEFQVFIPRNGDVSEVRFVVEHALKDSR